MSDLKFDGKVMVIVPSRNGYLLMPHNIDLLVSFKRASDPTDGVLVSRDLEGLKADIDKIYSSDAAT